MKIGRGDSSLRGNARHCRGVQRIFNGVAIPFRHCEGFSPWQSILMSSSAQGWYLIYNYLDSCLRRNDIKRMTAS